MLKPILNEYIYKSVAIYQDFLMKWSINVHPT